MLRLRLLALFAALAVLGAGLPAAPAAVAATGSGACASHLVPATRFADTIQSGLRDAVDCAAWWGLVNGRTATRFDPAANVSRGQTSAMLARLLRNTGNAPDQVPSADFPDTRGHVFEEDIDLLASLRIVEGGTDGRFRPEDAVTRAQMASFIARTFQFGFDSPLAPGPVPFTDVSPRDVHRDNIGRLVAADIAQGTSPTTYEPKNPVRREQMAAFVTRSADVLLTRDLVTRPTRRPTANDAYHSRWRGAWVHLFDPTLKSAAGIRRMVDELAAADANVVIAQMVRRHDAYYTSSVLPRTPDPGIAPDFDALAELIRVAHARGIEVHAWFPIAPTWHPAYANLPAPPGWVYTQHGRNAPVADRWVTRSHDGTWTDYLDPGVPAVRNHVGDVVGEFARNYDVDGIHLDYVRYDGREFGYNPRALTAYRNDTGATGTPVPNDPEWTRWRRDQTRRLVNAARNAIRATGKDITLSAAVISWGEGPATPDRQGFARTAPYTTTLQDWDGWARDGALDAVIPMNYFRQHRSPDGTWFDQWIAYERGLAAATDVRVSPGPAGYLNRPANVHRQVTRAMRVDGAVLYSYQQPTEDGSRGIWTELARSRWHYAPTR
ncbi:family 10 glycosylhydrolase [Egicoccus sp. AB-alg2]|uniref:glycoside hydrolase family 10 protein n=1 Tax=Egicoccus sp. AB-alg2 TaxID=3242693 RepID=UPI00359E404A